jgi:hypothetical protein
MIKIKDSQIQIIFGSLLFIISFIFNNSWATENRTLIRGAIQNEVSCGNEDFMIWLSIDKNLIHQFSVPSQGTFNIDLVPGNYQLVAKNPKECLDKIEFKIKLGEKLTLDLRPTLNKRKPTAWGSGELASSLATPCSCIQAAGCPCYTGQGYQYPSYIQPNWNPWWMGYSTYYPNFFYPGAWSNYGLNQGFYPGSGNVAAAKPNLYISGPQNKDLKIKINFKEIRPKVYPTWLATSPEANENTWKIKLDKNNFLLSEKARYPFIYYDFRVDDDLFQAEKGFCAERNEALEKMSLVLNELGFKANEVKDFEEHWRIKMPPQAVCVFPQSNTELDKIATLETNPPLKKLTRILFIATYKSGMEKGRVGKFIKEPIEPWIAPIQRQPSSTSWNWKSIKKDNISNDFELREWGIGFTFDPKDRN